MGVAKLKKVELYYHKSVQEDVAKTLQHSGICQIIEEPDTEGRHTDAANCLGMCEERLNHIRYLFRALGGYYADPVSSIDRLLGERPILSTTELEQLAQETDLGHWASSVKKMEQTLSELRLEMSQLKADESILSHIGTFPYSLDILNPSETPGSGTKTLKAVLGTLKAEQLEDLKTALAAELETETDLFVSSFANKKEVWIVLIYTRAVEQQAIDFCVRNGMTIVEMPTRLCGTVSAELTAIAARSLECGKKETELLRDLKQTADKWMPAVQKLSDYWGILSARYQALNSCCTTERTVRTCFWVPEAAWGALRKQIEAASPVTAFVLLDPTEEDNPPALLRNNSSVKPFEILTNLYSPPPYGETDPTPLLAPFFFLFFGICLGDAGYAVIMMAAIWILFKKYRRIPKNVKEFILLFGLGAVSTFAYGVISGSFFGDFIDAFFFMAPLRSLKNALMIIDPMQNPMQVLGISLLLGLIHLMFGLGIAAYDCIRKKNYIEAAGDKISWMLFIIGIALILVGATGGLPPFLLFIAQGMTLLGAVTIFWYAGREKKGIFSKIISGLLALYGSTSYLGDVLSYSRLLALGFGSAVIGMIINLLGDMAAGIPYIGWLIAITVVVGGHLFGIAINVLGAFVHSLRLQYVEFFGKFYSGGGVPFSPLCLSTQYIEVADQADQTSKA